MAGFKTLSDQTFQLKFTPFPSQFVNMYNHLHLPVEVTRITGGPDNVEAFVYKCHLIEDNDGAPRAYGWNNPTNLFPLERNPQQGLDPYDHLGDATTNPRGKSGGFDHGGHDWYWCGVYALTIADAKTLDVTIDTRPFLRSGLPDPKYKNDPYSGKADKYPVVQPPRDVANNPAPGYYVSTTATPADTSYQKWQQNYYWDASNVPYGVWCQQWQKSGSKVTHGDCGLAIRGLTGAACDFAFRDTGPDHHLGEMSRCLCRTLIPTPDGKAVPDYDFVSFLVFPGETKGAAGVRDQVQKLWNAENSDELALFLAAGADLRAFKRLLRQLVTPDPHQAQKADSPLDEVVMIDGMTPKWGTNLGIPYETYKILWGLQRFGYQTDGTLWLYQNSVNL